jgi:hypothetical protein
MVPQALSHDDDCLVGEHITVNDKDHLIRKAALAAVRRMCEVRGDLSSADLRKGCESDVGYTPAFP